MLYGARLSLLMGFGATVVQPGRSACRSASPPATTAAASTKRSCALIDLLISVPPILLGLLILSVTPPSLWKTALAVGIIYVPIMVRLTRSVTLEIASEEIRAGGTGARRARAGTSSAPRSCPTPGRRSSSSAALRVTFAILLGAALSFLGLGVQPPASDWGLMIAEARPFIDEAPWVAIAPGIVLCVTVIAVNLVGDGLREVLDPRLKRGRG